MAMEAGRSRGSFPAALAALFPFFCTTLKTVSFWAAAEAVLSAGDIKLKMAGLAGPDMAGESITPGRRLGVVPGYRGAGEAPPVDWTWGAGDYPPIGEFSLIGDAISEAAAFVVPG